MKISILLALAAFGASPALAEVKSSSASHFELESIATVPAAPAATYAMLGRPADWWNDGHTYSGDSAHMALELKAGGCFCETWPDGSVEHGRVVLAMPGTQLRLAAALGPLQGEAVTATLTWTLKPVEGGTEVSQTYLVSGHVRGGADKLAPLVDQVLAEQLAGLKARLGR